MGSILRASCPCGYQSQDIYTGQGDKFKPYPVQPGLCGRCREVVPVETDDVELLCPRCGGKEPKVVRIYEPDDFIESMGDSARFACPSCGEESLRFDIVVVWD